MDRLRKQFAQTPGKHLKDIISTELLSKLVIEEVGKWRDRVYSPLVTLSIFLTQVLSPDHSCQDAVARELSQRVAQDKKPCSLNTGPYCSARKRLPLKLLTRLSKEMGVRLETHLPHSWKWRGRSIKLLDGTTVSMPDTAANQAAYPQNVEQKPGLGFPLARIVACISLTSGAVIDWAMSAYQGKATGELTLFRQLLSCFTKDDLAIADRLYCTYFTLAILKEQGADILTGQHGVRRIDFRKGKKLGKGDHLVYWRKPKRPEGMDQALYDRLSNELLVRETRVGGRILVSTLLDAKADSREELHHLYELRWNIELDLRSIKSVMQMDILRCKTPPMVQKETRLISVRIT